MVYKPRKEGDAWRVRDKDGNILASLSIKGRFWGDVTYWPALLDATTDGCHRYVRVRDRHKWEDVIYISVRYRDVPFGRFLMCDTPSGYLSFTEGFTGLRIPCKGAKSSAYKRRCALALIKERGQRGLVNGIRKGIKQSGLSHTYEGINIKQYLRGWESTIK